ncbi:hypothetical protein CFOL_v3_16423 [Cephalotus follicularis]|uniref:AT hook motif-containing protein n=1 Tax=Cephalotus follicularis TaxID=3775 RepID=A0A1Q3BY42_CEPFO|nr:hypothetical protein CFOL_v3_16423 [Cephalotus follicularis]
MNQTNQGNNPDASADAPVKRKRGRPRKYPRQNMDLVENVHVARDQNQNRVENACIPPGFGGINGNVPHQIDPNDNANDVMVGQAVYGVIEATFDAGYLLTVRVGNSGSTLRGVVFKPGQYVPVRADNDVAPGVQMIRRSEIPFPAENNNQVHGYNPQPRERNDNVNSHRNAAAHHFNEPSPVNQVSRVLPHAANQVASKSKQVPSMAAQSALPMSTRVNVVPVVLQPVNLSNGEPLANQPPPVANQAAHQLAPKGKQALEASHSSNGSTPMNQIPTVGNPLLPSQLQTSHQVVPKRMQNETAIFKQLSAETLQDAEAKSTKLPGRPFEKLLTEVIKRIQSPSQSEDNQTDSKSAGHTLEIEDGNLDQPLSIEPLQVVQPNLHNYSASMSKPLESYGAGKMTELLQAVQEKMKESQTSQVIELAAGVRLNIEEPKNSKS